MRRSIIALPLAVVTALAGCTTPPTVDPADQQACTDWAQYEQGMVQLIAIIQQMAQDPKGLTEDVATQFNTARNNLLVAYDTALKTAKSKDVKDALNRALDADSVIYFDLGGATDELIQESITSVAGVVTACAAAGVDVSTILKQPSQ